MIFARSASLSTTSILFRTASTARHALVHCSSPVPVSLSFRSLVSLADVLEVPKPMTDMLGRAGMADAIPGRRIEWLDILSLWILRRSALSELPED